MRNFVFLLMLISVPNSVLATECEDNFKKSGNPFKSTNYISSFSVPNLSTKDGMVQMRGIMTGEKMDMIIEDAESGTMLVAQRSVGMTRPIPTIIAVSGTGASATIEMTIKIEKGMFAKAEETKPYICKLLAQVKGGKESKLDAAMGSKTQNNADTTNRDVFIFSREVTNEARKMR